MKWFTQMTKTLKTLFCFISYHPSPMQPAGKVQSFGLEGCRYSKGGQIKTNLLLFSFVCVCVCVWEVFLAAWNNIATFVLFCFFLWKSVGIPVFLLMRCKSGSVYFLHKLLNETAYLRSMKSPGVEVTDFFLCSLRLGIDRQVRDRWQKGTIKRPILYSL